MGECQIVARFLEFGLALLQRRDVSEDTERAPPGHRAEGNLATATARQTALEAAAARAEDHLETLGHRIGAAVDQRRKAFGLAVPQDCLDGRAHRHWAHAEDLFGCLVQVLDTALGVDQNDAVRHALAHGLHQVTQAGELGPQGCGGLPFPGELLLHPLQALAGGGKGRRLIFGVRHAAL